LLPGSRDGHNSSLNCGVPLPPWAGVLGLVPVEVDVDHVGQGMDYLDDGDSDGIVPHELDIDTDLVIQLMERINTTASLDDDAM
jgi:hypothetical protein